MYSRIVFHQHLEGDLHMFRSVCAVHYYHYRVQCGAVEYTLGRRSIVTHEKIKCNTRSNEML